MEKCKALCKFNISAKNIFRIPVILMLSFVIGINIYSFNAINLAGEDLPTPFGYGISIVLTGSMEPTLGVDDLVVIKETKDVKAGDIVAFKSGESYTIHRVVRVDEETIITRGDANNVCDDPVPVENIKGVMVMSIPEMGKLIQALRIPIMFVCFIIFLFLFADDSYESEKDLDEIERIKTEIRKIKKDIEDARKNNEP